MATPYYADDLVELWYGDCLDPATDAWLAADVLITDPPYGVSYQSTQRPRQARFERITGDHDTRARDEVLDRWGTIRPWAAMGTWRMPRPAHTRHRLIWDKTRGSGPGMGDLGLAFGTSDEEIYLGGPWPRTPAHRRAGSVISTLVNMGSSHGPAARIGHPTPKPVGLMAYLIERAPLGTVADPFAGSGSTLLAAAQLGRRAVGVELEERYCEIAATRLANRQGDLLAALENP